MFDKKNQNKVFVIGFSLIFVVVIWSFARPVISKLVSGDENSDKKINEEIMKASTITPEALFKRLSAKDNKIFVFDLRSERDFGLGHIATSLNLSPEFLNIKAVNSAGADKTSNIVITNQGENVLEAAKKVNEMTEAGFSNTKYLQGGINAWKNKGYLLISSGGGDADESKIKKVDIKQLMGDASATSDTVQFLDAREERSFSEEHISGAINIPFSVLEKNQKEISPVKRVVVYGEDENEARRAAITLFDLNFFNVFVLEGGFKEWKQLGGKTEKSN
jgi:rhodanese-related sulfurtransferase